MPKFEIGETLRITKDESQGSYFMIGDIVKLVDINDSWYYCIPIKCVDALRQRDRVQNHVHPDALARLCRLNRDAKEVNEI